MSSYEFTTDPSYETHIAEAPCTLDADFDGAFAEESELVVAGAHGAQRRYAAPPAWVWDAETLFDWDTADRDFVR